MKFQFFAPMVLALAFSGAPMARVTASTACATDGLTLFANAPLLNSGDLTELNMASFFTTSGVSDNNLATVSVINQSAEPRTFRVLFELKAIPSDARLRESCHDLLSEGGEGCWIQRKIVSKIELAPGETWVRNSLQLESETYQGQGIDPNTSPFQQLLTREGAIPAGTIVWRVSLLCPRPLGSPSEDLTSTPTGSLVSPNSQQRQFTAYYHPTQAPTLLYPGNPTTEGFLPISSSTPTFVFAGNLDGMNLGDESAYRLSIWEIGEGESAGETMDRRATYLVKIGHSPVLWASDWPSLVPGKRYIWRVDALLRGLSNDWLYSNVFGFQAPSQGTSGGGSSTNGETPQLKATFGVTAPPGTATPRATPEQQEIIEALSLIIGPYRPVLEQLLRTSLPDPSGLRIGAESATRTDFRNLVQEILDGRASVTGAEATP